MTILPPTLNNVFRLLDALSNCKDLKCRNSVNVFIFQLSAQHKTDMHLIFVELNQIEVIERQQALPGTFCWRKRPQAHQPLTLNRHPNQSGECKNQWFLSQQGVANKKSANNVDGHHKHPQALKDIILAGCHKFKSIVTMYRKDIFFMSLLTKTLWLERAATPTAILGVTATIRIST